MTQQAKQWLEKRGFKQNEHGEWVAAHNPVRFCERATGWSVHVRVCIKGAGEGHYTAVGATPRIAAANLRTMTASARNLAAFAISYVPKKSVGTVTR